MAVRAARVKGLLDLRRRCSFDPVCRMALQAQIRLAQHEQVVVHGPVGRVAGGALFHVVRVLEHEGAFLLGVALGACFLDRLAAQIPAPPPPCVSWQSVAEDLPLRHGWWFGRLNAARTSW